ncbi:hypothetical protein [Roseomonas marmotae]|uniref:Uncharacterized protein n=1 Tax=Roseomonas marmotae TaxID=2768161 RepID=A0ABS3KFC4_9PROT|nr:hypothetical protein [Roseomonas marmotae]MBO1076144.1 hypothetical protein [Roseomonas marmotae]QTI81277.1 hypothetical protein IAI58_18135 [Roseomonas marmotae]
MVARPRLGPDGDWQVEIGRGPGAFGRGGFADAAAAAAWAALAAEGIKPSTIRLGPRRVLGSGAEALRRWATDQGTLPLAEGGTHLAPMIRLAPLMADPACALPLAALTPTDLAAMRVRRQAALGGAAAMLLEQAALAAAIDALRALYLPDLDNPLFLPAPDGLALLEEADCARLLAMSAAGAPDLHRALALLLTTGAAPELLLGCRMGQVDAAGGWLHLAGQRLPWPAGLALPAALPEAPLLGQLDAAGLCHGLAALGAALGRPGLPLAAIWQTGLSLALRDGRHLDEALALAGLHYSSLP